MKQNTQAQAMTDHGQQLIKDTSKSISDAKHEGHLDGVNKAVDGLPALDDMHAYSYTEWIQARFNSMGGYSRSVVEQNMSNAKSKLQDAKVQLADLIKKRNTIEMSSPKEPQIQTHEETLVSVSKLPSYGMAYTQIVLCIITIGMVMLGEWLMASKSFQLFANHKNEARLIAVSFSLAQALAFHLLPKYIKKIKQKVLRIGIAIGSISLLLLALIATAFFRSSYLEKMGGTNHISILWFLVVTLFFAIAIYAGFLGIKEGLKKLRFAYAAKKLNLHPRLKENKEDALISLKEDIQRLTDERDNAEKKIQNWTILSKSIEIMILMGYREAIATWKQANVNQRGKTPKGFYDMKELKLSFFYINETDFKSQNV